MTRFVKRPLAEDDLLEIWVYIAADDSDAADRVIDRIEASCQRLASSPLTGSKRDELSSGLRSFVVGRYVVFYAPTSDGIDVVRVLHGARDIGAIFDREL